MLFHSAHFILFFSLLTLVYYGIRYEYRWILLLGASYFYYACFNAGFLAFIGISTLVSYWCAIKIFKAKETATRKFFFYFNTIFNLGILFFFKYFNIAAASLNHLFEAKGLHMEIPYSELLVPLGISFYIFQVVGYVFDVYFEKRDPEFHLGIYALYISFFPKLICGPIERSTHLLNQFRNRIDFNYDRTVLGLKMVLWGFFKKIVIADNFAVLVDTIYDHPINRGGVVLVLGTFLFAFQVFCDFSAYSNIAIGLSKVLGFNLIENFNRPYLSPSVSEYWRRWHMSLTGWFNDYLYTPLAMALKPWGKYGVVLTVTVVFLISGMWHGARINYIIWGLLQGIALGYEILTKKKRSSIGKKLPSWISTSLSITLTFLFICFTYIFFRANSFSEAVYIITHLFSASEPSLMHENDMWIEGIKNLFLYRMLIVFIFYLLLSTPVDRIIKSKTGVGNKTFNYFVFSSVFILLMFFGHFADTNFIYFKF
jgi:alginate O-acetyltransferase complex protein AlgI